MTHLRSLSSFRPPCYGRLWSVYFAFDCMSRESQTTFGHHLIQGVEYLCGKWFLSRWHDLSKLFLGSFLNHRSWATFSLFLTNMDYWPLTCGIATCGQWRPTARCHVVQTSCDVATSYWSPLPTGCDVEISVLKPSMTFGFGSTSGKRTCPLRRWLYWGSGQNRRCTNS